jgi:hypothetical protein
MREDAERREIWNYFDGEPMQITPSAITAAAIEGRSSDLLRKCVEAMVRNCARELKKARWNLDDMPMFFTPDDLRRAMYPALQPVACNVCDFLLPGPLCSRPGCFDARQKLWEDHRLSEASQALGIPVLEDERSAYDMHTDFDDWNHHKFVDQVRAAGCENLRLKFIGKASYVEAGLAVEGYPDVGLVCCKREQNCTCLAGLKIKKDEGGGMKAEQAAREYLAEVHDDDNDLGDNDLEDQAGEIQAEAQSAPADSLIEQPLQAPPTAAELAQAAKEAKKYMDGLRRALAEQYAQALVEDAPRVWLRVLKQYAWSTASRLDENNLPTAAELRAMLGEVLAQVILPKEINKYSSLYNATSEMLLAIVNGELRACGRLEVQIVNGEVELERDVVGELVRRFERVAGWWRTVSLKTPLAVEGNLDNLEKIKAEWEQLGGKWQADARLAALGNPVDGLAALREQILSAYIDADGPKVELL